jgi:hypothetical protein
MINGGTGPVLAFTAVLYNVSEKLDIPFLTFRAWIGVWIFLYMVIAAFVDLNRFIHYATRFTDEIFSNLIAVIFIVNALYSPSSPVGIFHYFDKGHESHEDHVEVTDYSYLAAGLLSVVVCFGTTYLAIQLKSIKQSAFFGPRTRALIADFAVVGSALIWIVVDRVVFKRVRSETLRAPDQLGPTFICCDSSCRTFSPDDCPNLAAGAEYGSRPWVVDFFDLNGHTWVPFFAAVPAMLGFILLFLDNGITWHLIQSPDNKLKHGHAYNWDTVVIGIGILVNSCFGLPWLCAATVRSVNHLLALSEIDPETKKVVSVQETRLTNLFIHALILGTLFFMNILKLIPMSVLYGIFLYMGVTALTGNQFWERIKMLLMDTTSAKYPKRPYSEFLPRNRMNLMTYIQIGCFILLYGVKSVKQIALAFPIVIAFFLPVRTYLLPKVFTEDELTLLDGDDEDVKAVIAKLDPTRCTDDSEETASTQDPSSDTSGSPSVDEAVPCCV